MRRLYYIFSNVKHAQKVVDTLLLARIEINHMHVVAKEGKNIGDLPEATLFQKHDLRHSLLVGLGAGAILGVIVGLVAHNVLNIPLGGTMLGTALGGAVLGAWAASMVGMITTNTELKPYIKHIEKGKLLLIVDVPKHRVEEIEKMIDKVDPDARFKGEEPTIPTFP